MRRQKLEERRDLIVEITTQAQEATTNEYSDRTATGKRTCIHLLCTT